jgi:hypothetical protein
VLPQGFCPAPAARSVSDTSYQTRILDQLGSQKVSERALVVFGCGTVHLRKGVDLFLSCAATVTRLAPARPVRFVWIGGGYQPDKDHSYSCYLADQIERCGLAGTVAILDAIPDVAPAYAIADIFLLSSRLDPFPNVAIDAALHGIPVVCFEGTTGFADLLSSDRLTSQCVLPHLDVHGAASLIARLAGDEPARAEIGQATARLAAATFDTDRYVERLDALGTDAMRLMRQRKEDFVTLREDPLFDASVYVPAHQAIATRDEAINGFLARWQAVGLLTRPAANALFRRPCAGFHPQIYAHEHRDRYDVSAVNPLAHFIRSGRPPGSWWHEVLEPHTLDASSLTAQQLRVALHGHFFYPELAADLLLRLSTNRTRCDLLLTTDSTCKAALLENLAGRYDGGRVLVQIVPNHGRDLGPLLTMLGGQVLTDYDVIGHVHGKRSLAIDAAMGDSWREFLWQHLVGDCYPMMDGILERFASDPTLGIVFPEDPHLCDWDGNGEIAADLAARMGLEPLPPFFDFPIGSMFWARSKALRPLFELRLDWSDYPAEPLPDDGTILHAIERLLPFAARHAGYRYATTHVPGWSR